MLLSIDFFIVGSNARTILWRVRLINIESMVHNYTQQIDMEIIKNCIPNVDQQYTRVLFMLDRIYIQD